MAFPTIPTGGRIITGVQADTTATRTGPNLNTLTSPAGELIIAIVFAYQSSLASGIFSGWTNGFTEFADQGATNLGAFGMAYKSSNGAETGTFAVTQGGTVTGHAAFLVMSIPGAHASTAPEAGGYASTGDAGAFNPAGWDVEDALWIVAALNGETATTGSFTGLSTPPTNYANEVFTGISADVVGGIEGGVAFRQLSASSEDPGLFSGDTSSARLSSIVIAVRPSPNVSISAEVAAGTGAANDATTAAPLELANLFEGSSDGTTITTSTGSGDTFDNVVTAGTGSTTLYEDTTPLQGALVGRMTIGAAANAAARVGWSTKIGSRARIYTRAYYWFPTALPDANRVMIAAVGTDGTMASLNSQVEVDSTGVVHIRNWSFSQDVAFTATVSAGSWFRLEIDQTASGGAYDIRLFTGADLHNAVGSFTEQKTGSASGQSSIGGVSFGAHDSGVQTNPTVLDIDGVAVSSAGFVGPLSVAANITAQAAEGTGAANDAGGSAATAAEGAAGTGQALDATTSTAVFANAQAEAAVGTGAANDPGASATTAAEVAAGTGAANAATITAVVVAATVEIGAIRWVVAVGTSATSDAAVGTGAANQPTTTIAPVAQSAEGAGGAGDPTSAVAAGVQSADGTGAANQPGGSVAVGVASAEGIGVAGDPGGSASPGIEVAAGTGAALDATASTVGFTNAQAQPAEGTGQASDAGGSVATGAASADGAGSAGDPGGSAAPTTTDATGTGTANPPTTTVVVGAQTADGSGGAHDATISTAVFVNIDAQAAEGTGAASDPAATVAPVAQVAAGTGAAEQPTVVVGTFVQAQAAEGNGAANDAGGSVRAAAEAATGTGAAEQPTAVPLRQALATDATGTGAAFDAIIRISFGAAPALGVGEALDAAIFIPPPVPPPRWVAGDLTGVNVVESETAGSGHVESVLAGVGIIEGGVSV